MKAPVESTLVRTARRRPGRPGSGPAPTLVLAFECARPTAPPAAWSLADVDEVVLGRGRARAAEVADDAGGRRLELRVADPWMSSTHARLRRVPGGWQLEDAGSTNGSLVNGEARSPAALADGDLVELGQTFFIYREQGAGAERPALDRAPAPGLATLVPALAAQYDALARVAATRVSVLIEGETGTGKEVVARALHELSGRAGDFVAVNCGALPEQLVASELFGYRKGAFSGAIEDRPGLVRAADGGTLFLDEIGDLPATSQATLLRVLQEREVTPVGGTRPVKVDLRVVAATHRDVRALVAAGQFRRDLLARLGGFGITLPPLRARREDLGLLVAALLPRVLSKGKAGLRVQSEAARALFLHDWPLNIRELEQTLASAVALARDRIELEHLPAAVRQPARRGAAPVRPSAAAAGALGEAAPRARLEALLREHHGSVAAVARALGKGRTQIYRWIRRYGIEVPRPSTR